MVARPGPSAPIQSRSFWHLKQPRNIRPDFRMQSRMQSNQNCTHEYERSAYAKTGQNHKVVLRPLTYRNPPKSGFFDLFKHLGGNELPETTG